MGEEEGRGFESESESEREGKARERERERDKVRIILNNLLIWDTRFMCFGLLGSVDCVCFWQLYEPEGVTSGVVVWWSGVEGLCGVMVFQGE